MSIRHIPAKIKAWTKLTDRRDVWAVSVICLSGISGYFIGRLDPILAGPQPVRIEMVDIPAASAPATSSLPQTVEIAPSAPKQAGRYVASKSGTKYHLITCPSARTIAEGNRVWFETKEEAEAAGYAPAANCKGI